MRRVGRCLPGALPRGPRRTDPRTFVNNQSKFKVLYPFSTFNFISLVFYPGYYEYMLDRGIASGQGCRAVDGSPTQMHRLVRGADARCGARFGRVARLEAPQCEQ